MKIFQIASALIELGAALALMGVPSAMVTLLLGSPLDSMAAVVLGRLAGAALFALALACWLARGDAQGPAARGLIAAMAFYNLAVAALFTFAGLGPKLAGLALWPAVILHAAMAVWCLSCLSRKPVPTTK